MTLALKYRPTKWEDMVGQGHISLVLRSMVAKGTLPPSVIFSGSRGTGKTTSARILAAAVNCESSEDKPCGVCSSCLNMWQNADFLELDGASSGTVADMRELRQNAQFAPAGQYKVYVIDECHSLSKDAWNALLKVVEEPPPNVLFVFATTEPEKVPVTIASRSLSFIFRRLSVVDLVSRLNYVIEKEGFCVEPAAVERIAVAVDGGMRDALMVLEQSVAVSDTVTLSTVNEVLGLADEDFLFDLVGGIAFGDVCRIEDRVKLLYTRGANLEFFLRDLQRVFSELLRFQLGVELRAMDISSARTAFLEKLRPQLDTAEVRRILEGLWGLQDRIAVSAGGAHLAFLTGLMLVAKEAPKPLAWRQATENTYVPTEAALSADELLMALTK